MEVHAEADNIGWLNNDAIIIGSQEKCGRVASIVVWRKCEGEIVAPHKSE
jgi:hypothetical protein